MDIRELARSISASYDGLGEAARAARAQDGLVRRIGSRSLGVKACAVDGGIIAHRMHGADIVVVRAVAVAFTYEDSVLTSFDYYPSKSPLPSIEMMAMLDDHEANVFRSLIRLKNELSCAIGALERFSPGLLMLDGSLLPLPSDSPPEGSELLPLYGEVLSLYKQLFDGCDRRGCMLCGVIKDSRSNRLSKSLGIRCSDSTLCWFLLDANERTHSMPYSGDGLGRSVSVFYIKPSANDLPLRIELLGDKVDEAASLLSALSSISENFAYPAVLVEADMRAALDPREMGGIESSLHSMCGIMPLRRNSRPFR